MSDPTNITTSDNNSEDLSKKEILSIRNDYVFKRIFSNRAILASFLSAYLGIKISEDEVLIENPLIGPIEYKGKPSLPDRLFWRKVLIRCNRGVRLPVQSYFVGKLSNAHKHRVSL